MGRMICTAIFLTLIVLLPDDHRQENALKATIEQAESARPVDPSTTGEAILALARFLQDHARYHDAEPLLVRSTEIDEAVHGPSSMEAAAGWVRLAVLYHAEFRPDLEEPAARKAADLVQKLRGSDSLEYAYASANLAVALAGLGQSARAEPLLRRAYFLMQKSLPESHAAIRSMEANLGMIYLREGEVRNADPLLRNALEKSDPADSQARAAALAAVAELSIAEGQWAEAETMIGQAYRLVVARDPAHPSLIGLLRLRATVESHLGTLRQAAIDLSRSIELVKPLAGSESITFMTILNEYADVLHRLGRNGEAKEARRSAKSIRQLLKN